MQSTSKAVFNAGFYVSPEKEARRQFLCGLNTDVNRALILGGKFIKDGRMIAAKFPNSKVISLERDRDIYEKQLRESSQYKGIFVKNVDFSEYLDSMYQDVPFDLVFLDFNCLYSKKREDDISKMFKLRFDRDSVIAITFAIGRDDEKRIMETYCYEKVAAHDYEYYKKNRAHSIAHSIIAIARRNGYRLKQIDMPFPVVYKNTCKGRKSGMSMIFLPFKVAGGKNK